MRRVKGQELTVIYNGEVMAMGMARGKIQVTETRADPSLWDDGGSPCAPHPKGTAWRYRGIDERVRRLVGNEIHRYESRGLVVTTQLANMDLPDGSGEIGPTWKIAVSLAGHRPSDAHVKRALLAFGMRHAEEDNHEPGIARHFFLVVDPTRRVDCECKTTDTVVVEPDGHRWSNTKDGPCRGCRYGRIFGKACPIHGSVGAVGP